MCTWLSCFLTKLPFKPIELIDHVCYRPFPKQRVMHSCFGFNMLFTSQKSASLFGRGFCYPPIFPRQELTKKKRKTIKTDTAGARAAELGRTARRHCAAMIPWSWPVPMPSTQSYLSCLVRHQSFFPRFFWVAAPLKMVQAQRFVSRVTELRFVPHLRPFGWATLPPANMGLCTDRCRKTAFLLERAFVHFHVSWWEGINFSGREFQQTSSLHVFAIPLGKRGMCRNRGTKQMDSFPSWSSLEANSQKDGTLKKEHIYIYTYTHTHIHTRIHTRTHLPFRSHLPAH